MERRRTLLKKEDVSLQFKDKYFTIVSEADNNAIGWKTGYANSARTISISTDEGKTWTTATATTSGITLATLNTNDMLMIKGSNNEYFDTGGSWNSPRSNMFTSSGNFRVEGNIMSLIYGDDFRDKITLPTANSFRYMFYNCSKLTTAENLIMPATTLTESCYDRMFSNCTILTTAPVLPAQTLVTGCYSYMFNGSRALNNIRCLAVNHSASNCTNNWVLNVASSGTFYKNKNASWSRGNSAVPTNWVLDDYGCGIAWSASTFTTYMNTTSSKPVFINPNNVSVTFSSSDTSVATISSNGTVTIVASGTTVLTASFSGNDEYGEETVNCTLTVLKANANISWELELYIFDPEASSKPVFNNPNNLTVSFTSSNTSTATINNSTGVITYVSEGTTTLTAVFGGNNIYEASTVTCTLKLSVDYSLKYLTILSTAANNTISIKNNSTVDQTVETSINNGTTWTTQTLTASSTTLISVLGNSSKLLIRGIDLGGIKFSSTSNFNVFGNLLSLQYGDNFIGLTLLKVLLSGLFADCSGLKSAKNLVFVATTHNCQDGCYSSMFSNSGLTTAPETIILPLKGSSNDGRLDCMNMFYNCTNLTVPPSLPSTTLSFSCYTQMFWGCTKLTRSPELPATTLASDCYYGMFRDTNVLPDCSHIDFSSSTVVKSGGLLGLFLGTKVGDADLDSILPKNADGDYCLPVTDLGSYCYEYMFCNCVNLHAAPVLPATTLANSCYYWMFYGCTNLGYIKCLATNISAENCTTGWVSGVSSIGVFEKANTSSWTTGVNGIPNGWVNSFYKLYLTIVARTSCTVFIKNTNKNYPYYGKYSKDGTSWGEFRGTNNSTSSIAALSKGERLFIRGNTSSSSQGFYYCKFSVSGYFDVEGNLYSINSAASMPLTSSYYNSGEYARSVFEDCTTLISAKNLSMPYVTGSSSSEVLYSLFRNCTNLIYPPRTLPGATLSTSCYNYMFYGCTSLITAPSLPATTLALRCYQYMFYGCTSLVNAPSLPATTLASSCYGAMFSGCTSLTTAPELPATTLVDSCYSDMFKGCTNLTTAPTLPATTLANNCYYDMFKGCTNLTTAPTLPATTLANNCYYGMFRDCTSLTTAPELPATTLANECYYYMFYNCSSLNYIKCLAIDKSAEYCLYYWVSGVASSGTFVKYDVSTWNTGVSGIPTNWGVLTVEYPIPIPLYVTITNVSNGSDFAISNTSIYTSNTIKKISVSDNTYPSSTVQIKVEITGTKLTYVDNPLFVYEYASEITNNLSITEYSTRTVTSTKITLYYQISGSLSATYPGTSGYLGLIHLILLLRKSNPVYSKDIVEYRITINKDAAVPPADE